MDASTWTKDELYDHAQRLDVERRSQMTKDELVEAVRAAEAVRLRQVPTWDLRARVKRLYVRRRLRTSMPKDELVALLLEASGLGRPCRVRVPMIG
ncbi:MAG: Rho termination factor N-terminal domain-containing protein [Bacteroidota bacterium]